MLEAYTGFQAGSTTCRRGRGIPGVGGRATGGRPNNGLPLELSDQPGRPVIGSGNAWYASMCLPRNPFESAPTARFNDPKVLPLLQTMSPTVLPCRRGCPAGTEHHMYTCRQRTKAPALRTIRTTARHTLHARVPYRSPHPSPMHPWRLRGP